MLSDTTASWLWEEQVKNAKNLLKILSFVKSLLQIVKLLILSW